MNKIILFSGPIRSGKTSFLLDFYTKNPDLFDGFLAPDMDGLRKLLFLKDGIQLDFQLNDVNQKEFIAIGRFRFDKSVFEQAANVLNNLASSDRKYILIDEIGHLELDDHGFEPAFSDFLEAFKDINTESILILIVRDGLLDNVRKKYGLTEASICNRSTIQTVFEK